MNIGEIIEFIEDKNFGINDDWYFHATSNDLEVIKNILKEGIKSAYLRNTKGNNFNGKYYISLYKLNTFDNGLNQWLKKYPNFVINKIEPLYANRKKLKLRRIFINTRIPLRTSEWDGEYQQYLLINTSNFVALRYDLSYIFNNTYCSEKMMKDKLQLLRNIILHMHQTNNYLPIYDFSTKKEINKEKVLSLHI